MDPSLGAPPENVGMITYDMPFIQYWPNPSTAYGVGSGFVLLVVLVTSSIIVSKNINFFPTAISCFASFVSLVLRGTMVTSGEKSISMYQVSMILDSLASHIIFYQLYTLFSTWIIKVCRVEKGSVWVHYTGIFIMISCTLMVSIGISIIFDSSAIVRGAGYSLIVSSLSINFMGCMFPGVYIYYLIRNDSSGENIDKKYISAILVPCMLLFIWASFKIVFWARLKNSIFNNSELTFYCTGPMLIGLIILMWLVVNVPKIFMFRNKAKKNDSIKYETRSVYSYNSATDSIENISRKIRIGGNGNRPDSTQQEIKMVGVQQDLHSNQIKFPNRLHSKNKHDVTRYPPSFTQTIASTSSQTTSGKTLDNNSTAQNFNVMKVENRESSNTIKISNSSKSNGKNESNPNINMKPINNSKSNGLGLRKMVDSAKGFGTDFTIGKNTKTNGNYRWSNSLLQKKEKGQAVISKLLNKGT
ncbi:hypothetical protein BB558_003697 [Smittium angustum]|uniref:Uncharacterized protein n=1 Tax=Smittium angustum TaxID=133377 RepID=A0A2U1J5C9_SMIAN|nr:hypothetical protein BB558_003697 [Smittium angustum]